MKLEKVLDNLNSFEKNSFLKIVDGIINEKPKNFDKINKILTDSSRDLKNIDSVNVSKVFNLIEDEFIEYVNSEFVKSESQLDILIDIISKDGSSIIKIDWFSRLYDKKLQDLKKKIKKFKTELEDTKSDIEDKRRRDYKIYRACTHTAYFNDEENNQDKKITIDEQSILLTLSHNLGLSQEEVKLINYLILPIQKIEIDTVINELKNIGVIFYSKKNNTIYVADEVIRTLRKVRGKEIADKYFRRVLRLFREPQINLICKEHGIDWRQELEDKIESIIDEGISFSGVLINDIYKEGTTLTEKKKLINELADKKLNIVPSIKGTIVEEKVENLIHYFEDLEKDEKVGISIDGYERLLNELGEVLPKLNDQLKREFQFQDENVLSSSFMLNFNLKPRDILEIISESELEKFCIEKEIKTRGDIVLNILEEYKDAENLYLENYEELGYRDLATLKENGIKIKESNIGNKFEELTMIIFEQLGFNVDNDLRKKLNTTKDKADIILNMGNDEIIIIECKTIKESGYNKFSSVSRQLKSYSNLAEKRGYKPIKSLLVAPDFSDDFIKECGLEYELNLSLITAKTLYNILEGFKSSKLNKFPHNLLMRDVLIQEDRVLKAIDK